MTDTNHDSFIFYGSFFEAITELSDTEQLALFRAICTYGLTGECGEISGVVRGMFLLIKPQMDANAKRRESAKSGGAPKGNNNAKKQPKNNSKQPSVVFEEDKDVQENNQKQPNVNVNVNENVNVNANENENENENINSSGGDGESARERVREIISENWGREPSPREYESVEELYLPLGGITQDNHELLEEAVRSAAEAGEMNIKYVRGCFKKYRTRGIRDNDGYWAYEFQRDKGG